MIAEEVVGGLGSEQRHGLDCQEASARQKRYGPNELKTEKPVPAWRRFLAQFQDVLIILLLVATAISVGLWVYERDTALPYEGLTIFAIVLLNGILGYVQEARAERAVAALRAMSANEATVLRDGERGDRVARRRATERARGGAGAGRRYLGGRGRHDTGRRSPDRVDRAPYDGSVAHGRESAGVQGRGAGKGRGGLGGSAQHDLLRHGGYIRTRQGRGDGHGDAHRAREGRWAPQPDTGADDAPAEGARPCRQAARWHRARHRGGGRRHDPPCRGDTRLRCVSRRAHLRRGAGGRGRARGLAGDRHDDPGARSAADGRAQLHRAQAPCGRDFRLGYGDRLR